MPVLEETPPRPTLFIRTPELLQVVPYWGGPHFMGKFTNLGLLYEGSKIFVLTNGVGKERNG